MPSDLGTVASHAMEQWLFLLWLRPFEQGSEVRELDVQPVLQVVDNPRLVADREPLQSLVNLTVLDHGKATPMTDSEREAMFKTAVRQIALQRAEDAVPLVKPAAPFAAAA